MQVIPSDRIDQLEFAEVHAPIWLGAGPAVGITVQQAQGVDAGASATRAAYQEALAAREASRAATSKFYTASRTLRELLSGAVRSIKTFAEMQADPDAVYQAAQIPLPSPPTPQPLPGKPINIIVTLEPSGAVTLSWEAVNASAGTGAFFTVSRKLPGQSDFVSVGGAPGTTTQVRRPRFTDTAVPAAVAAEGPVVYLIQARRGYGPNSEGPLSDAISVQFGVTGLPKVSGATLAVAA